MGMDPTETCINCERDAGYHRAVVDTVADRVLGGLCRECEQEEFGRILERGLFKRRDGCILCERDGHVALPIWRPVARRTGDGTVVNEVTYTVEESTVTLCDEHVSVIAESYPLQSPRPVTPE